VSHQGTHARTHTPTQSRVDRLVGELAAGKLFVVGCDGQGLGMCLELQGSAFPTQQPLIRNGARDSQPLHRHVEEVSFNKADI
jgi:hypothetical protein